MVLTVHHLENSQSLRVVWLLEELGIDYELKLYKRDPVSLLAPPELKAISPLGTSPVITNDDGDVVLCETNAIIDYLLDVCAISDDKTISASSLQLRPAAGTPERLDYLFFFHGGQASLGTNTSGDYIWSVTVDKVPCLLSPILRVVHGKVQEAVYEPRISKFMDVTEDKLKDRDFVAGLFLTAADISMIFPMEVAFEMDAAKEQKYPKCKAWLGRMYARDAHKRAMSKVGEVTK